MIKINKRNSGSLLKPCTISCHTFFILVPHNDQHVTMRNYIKQEIYEMDVDNIF